MGNKVNKTLAILVVDDDAEMTEMLVTVLADAGYDVAAAGSGHDALAAVDRFAPTLVITDLSMPGMSGLELIERIRMSHPAMRVILLTAFGDWPSFCRAQDLRVDRYLTKPIAMDELLESITELLGAPVVKPA